MKRSLPELTWRVSRMANQALHSTVLCVVRIEVDKIMQVDSFRSQFCKHRTACELER